MGKKKALITGITGQDGSYLAELLLNKNYEVHGMIRRSSSFNTGRIDHLFNDPEVIGQKLFLHYGDVVDTSNINRLLEKIAPDEIYNLAAQSHVKVSFDIPDYTAQVDALGTLRFLDAIREVGLDQQTKFYQASTSELFGKVQSVPQDENTPFYPRSPYGVAKLYGYWIVKNYREAYNLYCCNGILFNHESPRRGETFLTRKVTYIINNILFGKTNKLLVGNLNSKRDWGYAPEYCEGMWKMLQQNAAEDYVLATGETHTIREFIESAFSELGIYLEWDSKNNNEKGIIAKVKHDEFQHFLCRLAQKGESDIYETTSIYFNDQDLKISEILIQNYNKNFKVGNIIVETSEKYLRPTEVDLLIGNPSKAMNKLNWQPENKFEKLVGLMMKHELLNMVRKELK